MALYNFQSARAHVESMLNYQFTKPHLLEEALHAGGPIYINGKYITEGNKWLAMIGDSALDLALAVTDYQAGLSRGAMSNRRTSVASNENLCCRSRKQPRCVHQDECPD